MKRKIAKAATCFVVPMGSLARLQINKKTLHLKESCINTLPIWEFKIKDFRRLLSFSKTFEGLFDWWKAGERMMLEMWMTFLRHTQSIDGYHLQRWRTYSTYCETYNNNKISNRIAISWKWAKVTPLTDPLNTFRRSKK